MAPKPRSKRPSVMKLMGAGTALHVIRDPEERTFTFLPSEFGFDGKPICVSYDEIAQLTGFLQDEEGCEGRTLAVGSQPPVGPPISRRRDDERLPETCPQRPSSPHRL
jgi:hypothetical protein